jgi:hypothetical protein
MLTTFQQLTAPAVTMLDKLLSKLIARNLETLNIGMLLKLEILYKTPINKLLKRNIYL